MDPRRHLDSVPRISDGNDSALENELEWDRNGFKWIRRNCWSCSTPWSHSNIQKPRETERKRKRKKRGKKMKDKKYQKKKKKDEKKNIYIIFLYTKERKKIEDKWRWMALDKRSPMTNRKHVAILACKWASGSISLSSRSARARHTTSIDSTEWINQRKVSTIPTPLEFVQH